MFPECVPICPPFTYPFLPSLQRTPRTFESSFWQWPPTSPSAVLGFPCRCAPLPSPLPFPPVIILLADVIKTRGPNVTLPSFVVPPFRPIPRQYQIGTYKGSTKPFVFSRFDFCRSGRRMLPFSFLLCRLFSSCLSLNFRPFLRSSFRRLDRIFGSLTFFSIFFPFHKRFCSFPSFPETSNPPLMSRSEVYFFFEKCSHSISFFAL